MTSGTAPRNTGSEYSPTISVIIPVYNGVADVPNQLAALDCQLDAPPFEVLLVDNRSTDHLGDALEGWTERFSVPIRLTPADAVSGVSHARNVGMRTSEADVLLICDADDVVGRRWVNEMLGALRDHELVGGGLEVDSLNKGPERFWRVAPDDGHLPVSLQFLPYAQGCNVGVWREVALQVGGWDEGFTQGGDDVDFAWRIQLAGHRVGLAPEAVIAYRYRRSLRATAKQGFVYALNDYRLLEKFAEHGLKPRSELRLLRTVVRDATRLPRAIGSPRRRGAWLYRTAVDAGALTGQLRYRARAAQRALLRSDHG